MPTKKQTAPAKKKPGRPALAPELRRSVRLHMRTYPEVDEKVKRVGTEAVESAVMKIKTPSGQLSMPAGATRTGRVCVRTYPEVKAKAQAFGNQAVEVAIMKIKEPEE